MFPVVTELILIWPQCILWYGIKNGVFDTRPKEIELSVSIISKQVSDTPIAIFVLASKLTNHNTYI